MTAIEILIYIRECDSPADCWCPAYAAPLGGDDYRVSSTPPEKSLEFGMGDVVRCERQTFPDGSEALVAVARGASA